MIPTKTALNEMDEVGIDMYKVVDILNQGFDCSRSKREKHIEEKCFQRGNKIIKIVVIDKETYYKIIHIGKFTVSKKFKKTISGAKNENGFG